MKQHTLNDKHNDTNHPSHICMYICGAICLALFLTALILVLSGHASLIDDPIRFRLYALRQDGLNAFVSGFTLLGNWQSITALCIVLLIIPATRRSVGLPLSAGNLIVATTNKLLKHLIHRLRPDTALFLIDENGFSFPSGHSISGMYTYGLLLYFILTKVKNTAWRITLAVILTVLAFGIGFSRIYLGVHFPTDVLAGWSLGALGVIVTILFLDRRSGSPDR